MANLLAVMTSTAAVDLILAAVNTRIGRVGPGLYGVACSGGADSLVLADAAIRVAGPAHVVVHVYLALRSGALRKAVTDRQQRAPERRQR